MKSSQIIYVIAAVASLVLVGLATPANSQEQLVDDICLGCICEAISGCNITTSCSGDVCGLFRITWFYWADSGKLTVNGESADSPTAFENCAVDPRCASQTVQNYMQSFKQDCNGDNKIDCYDYASIHKLGGYGCPGRIFGSYARKLNQCLRAYGPSGK
ncbi:lysozyme-like [Episyrphus balteatus]|uniref:lysozyme-like n=1 Tax=Episyrphus balteatus TaxID=286459 RepID=UPI002484E96B|nr:lysozyme-like [Episyrphus balteatus]